VIAAICIHRVTAGARVEGLDLLAYEHSPRVETVDARLVLFDASGLERLFGGIHALAAHVEGAAAARGWTCGIAFAVTRAAAMLLASAAPGLFVVTPGQEAARLAALPVSLLTGIETLAPHAGHASAGVSIARGSELSAAGEAAHAQTAARDARNAARAPARDETGATARGGSGGARDPRARSRGGHQHYRLAPVPMIHAPGERAGQRSGRGNPEGPAPAPSEDDAIHAAGHRAGKPDAAARERLAHAAHLLDTFTRWGVGTLGDLAALPADGLRARLGPVAVQWQRLARGEDLRPLVRDPVEERFEAHLSLEWPIEGLEPLSFVLARLLDPLCQQLERRDRGAVGLRLWLKLVTRAVFTRYLQVPVPMRDPKVLRTLLALDLESHPPPAGIDEVTLACDVAPGRVLQHSLLTRPLPSPDCVSTLVARLTALMGEGRCGHPVVPDTHRPGSCLMQAFSPEADDPHQRRQPARGSQEPQVRLADEGEAHQWQGQPSSLLRRFRRPVVAQVAVCAERPVRVSAPGAGVRGSAVRRSAGPWRTSGCWWAPEAAGPERGAWDRDEWDVALDDRVIYRICRHRATGTWMVEGYWD
jgi:nucleotidyltransferase/DNA polymerase involved in DNA repair